MHNESPLKEEQPELDLGQEPLANYDNKDDVIANLSLQITNLQGQVAAMEHFSNIVISQRNEAQNEVAKLQTQAAMKGY